VLDGVDGQRHALTVLNLETDPLLIVQEAECAPGPVWTGAENLAYTGIRSPDRAQRNRVAISHPSARYGTRQCKILL